MVRQAVILAAGKGSRMETTSSKPMTKVGDKKLIQYGLDGLLENGIDKIYVIYSEYSEDVLQLKELYPNVKFIKQEVLNGSLASFQFIETVCNAPFLLLDCDIIFSPRAFAKMLASTNFVEDAYAYMAIVLKPTENNPKYIKISNNRITDFDKAGFVDGHAGGMIFLWNKFPSEEVKDFFKQSNRMGAFLKQIVKEKEIRPMFIESLLDVDTKEEIIEVEKSLKEILK